MWKTVSSFQHHWWALALGKGRSTASLLPLLAGCSPSEVTQWAKTAARIRVKWDTLQKCRLRQHAHRYTYKWERSASILWESFLRGPVCAPCLHSLTSLSWDLVWYPINHPSLAGLHCLLQPAQPAPGQVPAPPRACVSRLRLRALLLQLVSDSTLSVSPAAETPSNSLLPMNLPYPFSVTSQLATWTGL